MFLIPAPIQKKRPKRAKKSRRAQKSAKEAPNVGQHENQKDRAELSKPKLIVFKDRSKKVFKPDPNPKDSPEQPKKGLKSF